MAASGAPCGDECRARARVAAAPSAWSARLRFRTETRAAVGTRDERESGRAFSPLHLHHHGKEARSAANKEGTDNCPPRPLA